MYKRQVLSAPYNKGYEVLPKENKIAFYYRDDNALIDDKLADKKVSVDINGTEHEMTYNAGNKRFEYNYNKLESGYTYYRYKVGDEYILDKYNDKQEQKEGNDINDRSHKFHTRVKPVQNGICRVILSQSNIS